VAYLPGEGTLLFCTDLHGCLPDYLRMIEIYEAEEAAGNQPFLLFCGDLVHGPDDFLAVPENWPEYLGQFYRDESAELIQRYHDFAQTARTISLLGNHEHAHIGGPLVSKFHVDEAAVLEKVLGRDRDRIRAFFNSFPLIAVAPCGATFTHGAPSVTEPSLEAFEGLTYEGYEDISLVDMYGIDTVGALLWARSATADEAQRFLAATRLPSHPKEAHLGFVAYGHDIIREGYVKAGPEQICVSSSYGLFNENKVYLRLDLAARYETTRDLREDVEILRLYPR
jgi:hypothetical protein